MIWYLAVNADTWTLGNNINSISCLSDISTRGKQCAHDINSTKQMFDKLFLLYFQKVISSKILPYVINVRYSWSIMVKSISICSLKSPNRQYHSKLPDTEICIFGCNKNLSGTYSCRKYQASDIPSRSLFQFPGSNRNTRRDYAGRKLVGYSPVQMYDVVADVEHYNTFVPFCKKSDILSKNENNLVANLVIGFPPVIESYISHVTLVKPHLVKAVCTEGKLFNHLLTTWKFSTGLKNNLQTCIIDFYVSFDFRSPLYSHLAKIFFNELVRQMESAFYEEAKARYGKPSIKDVKLRI